MFGNPNDVFGPEARAFKIAKITLEEYKNKLAESDYKVIKCYEYSLAGLDLPYDVTELHAEREAIREEIRTLEEKIIEYKE